MYRKVLKYKKGMQIGKSRYHISEIDMNIRIKIIMYVVVKVKFYTKVYKVGS